MTNLLFSTQLVLLGTEDLDTHVCSAAFVALMSEVSVSFSRINITQSSFPCGEKTRSYSEVK